MIGGLLKKHDRQTSYTPSGAVLSNRSLVIPMPVMSISVSGYWLGEGECSDNWRAFDRTNGCGKAAYGCGSSGRAFDEAYDVSTNFQVRLFLLTHVKGFLYVVASSCNHSPT